jgi:hypothetical protein
MNRLRRVNKQNQSELTYEMNPFEWKLAKLMNGKTNVQIVRGIAGLKDWNRDAPDLDWERRLQAKEIIIEPSKMTKEDIRLKQMEIDKLEIERGFPKDVWKYCKFSRKKVKK